MLGIGFGWNADELEDHGVTMAERRAVAREHVLAMQALWRDDVGEFDGEHVHIAPSWSWPKPVRPDGPAGAHRRRGRTRSCSPTSPSTPTAGSRSAAPACAPRSPTCTARATRSAATRRRCGSCRSARCPTPGKLEYYESIGITEVVLRLPGGDADAVLADPRRVRITDPRN